MSLLLLLRGSGVGAAAPARRGVRVVAGPARRSGRAPARPTDHTNTTAYIDPPPDRLPAGPPYTPNPQP